MSAGGETEQNIQAIHERSSEEKHWDQICLGITTIATAVLAATLATAGLTDPGGTWATTIRTAMTALATGTYSAIVIQAGRTIFLPKEQTNKEKLYQKERKTNSLFAMFVAMLAPLAIMVLSETIDTTFDPKPRPNQEAISEPPQHPQNGNEQQKPENNLQPTTDTEDSRRSQNDSSTTQPEPTDPEAGRQETPQP